MTDRNKCGDCRHWDASVCRRYPPQVVPYPNDNQHPVIYFPAEWVPSVGATHPACGEFSLIKTGV